MRVLRVFIVGAVLAVIAILSGIVQDVRDAQAIPAFARKYDFACNVCHVPGFPKLNDFGNVFRDQGYQLGTDGDLPTFEALGKGFWPVSLRTTVGYQVADLRLNGQSVTTSGFGFTGLDVLSFGTLARNLSFGVVFTPGLHDAGFGTGSSVEESDLESAFVRVLNLERFVGGAENTYLMNLKVGKFELDLPFSEKRSPTLNTPYLIYHFTPFGTANPFGLGDNQPGIELTGIKRTDMTGGYLRYSLGGFTTNGGSFGDVSGRSAYFYGHVTQSFGGYGIVAGQRIGAFVLAGNAPTLCPASTGGGAIPAGGCPQPGSGTQGEPFRRVGVDVSLTYGGQWNLFGVWMFANDSSNLITTVSGLPAQNAHWNGGFIELNYNPIQLPKWLFIYRYDWITNTQQGDPAVPGNVLNEQGHTIMARYYIHQSTRTDLALHAEYNSSRIGGGGVTGNEYTQTTLVGFDFAF
ncbi:MAG: hypothetical protein E6K68_02015 [Nitrospirae bacterium]|nr:MAG: hypothetical protein E6K68_02015 [Nitrospirota bacterium]